jgi:hypothetical protein
MKILRSTMLVVFFLGVFTTLAFSDSATLSTTECDLWGPVSYIQQGNVVFNATINPNWVIATCKWQIPDFDNGRAEVRTYSGQDYNVCNIVIGVYPDEVYYRNGSGHSTISASGMVTVKCKVLVTP